MSSAGTAAIIGNIVNIFECWLFLPVGCVLCGSGMLIAGLAKNLNTVIGGDILNGLGAGCGFLSTPLIQEIGLENKCPIASVLATVLSAV